MNYFPWYYQYSFWIFYISILQFFKIVPFSIIPSVICICIVVTFLLIWKIYLKIPMNIPFLIVECIVHVGPLLYLPLTNITNRDITINLLLFTAYLIWLTLNNQNILTYYRNLVYENEDISLIDYAKQRKIISV